MKKAWSRRTADKSVVVVVLYTLFVLCCLVLASPVRAGPQPAPSVNELQQLLDTIQDDKARAQFVGQLKTMIEVRHASKPPHPDASPIGWLAQGIDQLNREILEGTSSVANVPSVVAWGRVQIEDDIARRRWRDIALAVVIAFGCAGIAEWLVRRFLARARRRSAAPAATRSPRLLFALLHLVIDILPIVAFGAVAYIVLPFILSPGSAGRTALALIVQATVLVRLILAVAKSLLLVEDANFGLPMSEETRNYLYIWIKRFTYWGVLGYTFAEGARWLGIPESIYALTLKVIALVLAILVIVFVMQNRGSVGEWIASPAEVQADTRYPNWHQMRRRFSEVWHVLAIAYIVGMFAVYALHISGGFGYLLQATALTLAAIIGARLLIGFAEHTATRGFSIALDLKSRFPTLEQRTNRYLPILTGLIRIVVYFAALLLVLEAWDIRSFAWFETDVGRRTTGIVLSVAAVIGAALVVWEIFSAAIERHLAKLTSSSRTRQRTLLPLLRTTMLCIIVVMAGLIVLSEIGVNIAPLLAGAGVVGLAIGFGSQALVKDIITGLFILIEDQIAVGDIVDVGKDHKGTVEAVSIRTIRLRDQAGVVHTVPFSEVTSIRNMTKDFAYAVAHITIAYSEDIDRVVDILRGASEALMTDESVAPFVLDPFNYQGVDSLDEYAVVLLVRIRTLPGKHLVVGRAFNRLVKLAFDEHGILGRDPTPMIITRALPKHSDGALEAR